LNGCPDAGCIADARTDGKRCDELGVHRLSEVNDAFPLRLRQHTLKSRRCSRRRAVRVAEENGIRPRAANANIGRPQDREAWLTGTVDEAKGARRQYPQDSMVAYRVSARVNSPKNNDPSLITPVDVTIDPTSPQMPLIQ
jgi:hypothetical protein